MQAHFRLKIHRWPLAVSAGLIALGVTLVAAWLLPPAHANRALPTDLSYSTETTWLLPGLPALSTAAGAIPHNYQQGEATFQLGGETIHGFRPGAAYTELSLRHLAWSLEAAPYYYPAEYLRQPVEAFLARQQANGAIGGTLTPQGQLIPQNAASDAPASLIHAAYLYYRLTYNADWLAQPLNGDTIINRLNRAAEWLVTHRLEPERQLVWRGHTPDWGDAPFTGGPKSSTFNPAADSKIASIYDQALTYTALLELAKMNAAVNNIARADRWQTQAETIKSQTNAQLWQPDRGFYRPHVHLTPLEHPFDEAEMVSASNALAVYSGLADAEQTAAIFSSLEQARQAAGVSKPGLSLYPYYPDDYFGQPELSGGSGYNGGVWDWWGGVQIKAEFDRGYSEMGRRHLMQAAADWQKIPGSLLEWQSSRQPQRQGSATFTTAAGAMGSAIINGLFGVDLGGHGLRLQPRLGLNDGYIRAYQPATDHYAAYSYDWDQAITRLDYGTNAGGPVIVKILKLQSEQISEVLIDGQPVDFSAETVGRDTYIVFSAPSGQHRIELRKNAPAPPDENAATPVTQFKAAAPGVVSNPVTPPNPKPTAAPTPAPPAAPVAAQVRRMWQTSLLQFASAALILITSLGLIGLVLVRRRAGLTFTNAEPRRSNAPRKQPRESTK